LSDGIRVSNVVDAHRSFPPSAKVKDLGASHGFVTSMIGTHAVLVPIDG